VKPVKLLAAAGITIAATLATAPVAGADAVVPIGPNQAFHGLVNGVHDNAQITMVCPGPVQPGQTGHPASNQTISVTQAPSSGALAGYTGSLGTSVVASFVASSAAEGFTFTTYNVPQKLPTTMNLPCSGTGTLTFVPQPTSDTARADTVKVTFVNIAV
jgi:hypothetical protein